jgi:hypothetical protein
LTQLLLQLLVVADQALLLFAQRLQPLLILALEDVGQFAQQLLHLRQAQLSIPELLLGEGQA